jgi:hypothetical protein
MAKVAGWRCGGSSQGRFFIRHHRNIFGAEKVTSSPVAGNRSQTLVLNGKLRWVVGWNRPRVAGQHIGNG